MPIYAIEVCFFLIPVLVSKTHGVNMPRRLTLNSDISQIDVSFASMEQRFGHASIRKRLIILSVLVIVVAVVAGAAVLFTLLNLAWSKDQLALAASGITATLIVVIGIPMIVFQKKSLDAYNLMMNAINVVDAPLTIFDPGGKVVQFNDAAVRFQAEVGVKLSRGVSIQDLIAQSAPGSVENPHDWERWVQDALESRRLQILGGKPNTVFTRKTRRYHQVLLAELDSGHVVDMRTDVTESKMRELALKQREVELENSRNEAQASNRAKSEFLANMSHEIRTPMNGVIGMTELLLDSDLNSEQRMYALTVSKSGLALLTIINDILDFSKIEAGKLELDICPFNLRSALDDVAALLATRAHAKGIELIMDFSPDLPDRYAGDVGRLRQIMTNLTGNAIKFTETGHVVVSVNGHVENDQAELTFSVRDTGIGIPKAKQQAVFREFEQVDSASNRKYEGTGLGLAISRKLIRLMGSEIQLKSIENEGSDFFFTVTMPVDTAKEATHIDSVVDMDFTGRRVLIVDDLPINREILSRQVQSWGMSAVVASSGEKAIEVALLEQQSDKPIEIAIFDYQMPGMDGHALCRHFKDDELLKDIPVLLLSSVDQSTQRDKIRQLGFADCMIKPTRAEVLKRLVNKVLSDGANKAQSENIDISPSRRQQAREQDDSKVTKILVVEDNEINQLVISSMLDTDSFELEIADNGQLGFDQFKVFEPDLVFMDVSMPVMNGFDSTALIREYERDNNLNHCPVVALTANAMQGDREKCLEAGMDDFMSKPIIMNDLYCLIEKWLDLPELSRDRAA